MASVLGWPRDRSLAGHRGDVRAGRDAVELFAVVSVWVWRTSPDGFSRPYRVSGCAALPYLVAHRLLNVIRKLEKALSTRAHHGRDRLHVGEHPSIRAREPSIARLCHHIDEVAHRDDGTEGKRLVRDRAAGQRLDLIESVGLHHARSMDREWPTI